MIEVNLSVREVVEFILKEGDIDAGFFAVSAPSVAAMRAGAEAHKFFQKKRAKQAEEQNASYESEVTMSIEFTRGDFSVSFSGRADGVWEDETGVYIEEIKSTHRAVSEITTATPWHFGQCNCYAHMYCKKTGKDGVFVRMIYINVDGYETSEIPVYRTREELSCFFDELIGKYMEWVKFDYERKRERDANIGALSFPFGAYRAGQREFAVFAYRAIERGEKLFIEAPTGTGKTISAIFPAVKALGLGLCDKIFYLTAKTPARAAAESTMKMLRDKNCPLLSVSLTAKDKLCATGESVCTPTACPRAAGHFDRVNGAVFDMINNESIINAAVISEYSEKHTVCPHELALDASIWCDALICDYNYVFDPKVKLRRFFEDGAKKGRYAILADEAHNLDDRAREMFSASAVKSVFWAAKKASEAFKGNKVAKILNNINGYFLKAKRELGERAAMEMDEQPLELYQLLEDFILETGETLHKDPSSVSDDFVNGYFAALDFLSARDRFDERFTCFCENDGDVTVKLLCLDPSKLLAEALKNAQGAVFFSATLTPGEYFRRVLGGAETDAVVRLPSPFRRENLFVFIERLSTRYKNRADNYEKIADVIFTMISAKKGNYFAFFPSYTFLREVYAAFSAKYPQENTIAQSSGLGENERAKFLANFDRKNPLGLLAFAVMGGAFSEGIDLPGERLIGVAVVGVGLPQINEERDVMARYYERTSGSGFDFAYVFPGMNKVLQAAGRVVREENDTGAVILIDDRFLTRRYTDLFPRHWSHFKRGNGLKEYLTEFWEDKE
ncbi:ATP-dependent helicase [Clostridia bacterium]|nr:ATP-dependent helicase [Clostridia bacterium]